MVASGAEVTEFTASEMVEIDYVMQVRAELDAIGSDDFTTWIEDWVEMDETKSPNDPNDYTAKIISALVEVGSGCCEATAGVKEAGESPETAVRMMAAWANADESWSELTMAACIAAVQTLCPELEAYVAKGIGSTGSG